MAILHTFIYKLIIAKKRINKFKIIHSSRVKFVEEEDKLKTRD